jgi:hypothetical protein
MQAARNLTQIVHILLQARKITLSRVTGEMRPYRGISGISNKIQQLLCLKFISKNLLFSKISSKNPLFIRLDHYLPLT